MAKVRRAMTTEHSHPESWPTTMDWIDLRNHLTWVHGADAVDVDDLTRHVDGLAGRRRHAEDRHRMLHLSVQGRTTKLS
jgi:hypothetical protein